MSPLLELRAIHKEFAIVAGAFQRVVGHVTAVSDINLAIEKGRTLGVVGESGCGKSTLARVVIGLYPPTSGEVVFDGNKISGGANGVDFAASRRIQMVFQDPYSSLDPRVPVGASIGEGLAIHGIGDAASRRQAVGEILQRVGLPKQAADRYPHEFSGGQRQRIGIARALILEPELFICDEPTSALDVSVQAQILNLLRVLNLGHAVEVAPADELFARPRHPYTQALLSATPIADPDQRGRRVRLAGELPSPLNPPSGCPFNPRCPLADDRCRSEMPALLASGPARVACHALAEGRASSLAALAYEAV